MALITPTVELRPPHIPAMTIFMGIGTMQFFKADNLIKFTSAPESHIKARGLSWPLKQIFTCGILESDPTSGSPYKLSLLKSISRASAEAQMISPPGLAPRSEGVLSFPGSQPWLSAEVEYSFGLRSRGFRSGLAKRWQRWENSGNSTAVQNNSDSWEGNPSRAEVQDYNSLVDLHIALGWS